MGRIQSIFNDEERLHALLKSMDEGYTKIGSRRGIEAKNAAHALSDFGSADDSQDRRDLLASKTLHKVD